VNDTWGDSVNSGCIELGFLIVIALHVGGLGGGLGHSSGSHLDVD
jgi:hypothetical protein